MNIITESFIDELKKIGSSSDSGVRNRRRRSGRSDATKAVIAGGTAGVISGVATRPISVVQTRQAMGDNVRQSIRSVYREGAGASKGAKSIVRGLRGFWKGGTTKALGIGAGMAITYPAYNALMRRMNRNPRRNR